MKEIKDSFFFFVKHSNSCNNIINKAIITEHLTVVCSTSGNHDYYLILNEVQSICCLIDVCMLYDIVFSQYFILTSISIMLCDNWVFVLGSLFLDH